MWYLVQSEAVFKLKNGYHISPLLVGATSIGSGIDTMKYKLVMALQDNTLLIIVVL